MIVAEIIKKLEVTMQTGRKMTLEEGKRYVSSDFYFEQLRRMFPGVVGKVESFDKLHYREYKGEELHNKTIMTWRTGGIGDIMFMLPSIRIIKMKYPTCKIRVASADPNHEMFFNLPYVDEIYTIPFDFELAKTSDCHLTFQQIIEENPEAGEIPAVDLFMRRFKLPLEEFPRELKVPEIVMNEEEKKFADENVKDLVQVMKHTSVGPTEILSPPIRRHYRIGIQFMSSSPIRTLPINRTVDIIYSLLDENDIEIYMFGGPNQNEVMEHTMAEVEKRSKEKAVKLYNAFKLGGNLRKSIALASRMDLIIGPDSSMLHIAGALGIPMIGIYGPFPSHLRMRYYKNAIGLDAAVSCSPCFTHGNSPCHKSVNRDSPCFSVLTDKVIYEAINFQKKKSGFNGLENVAIVNLNESHKILDRIEEYMVGEGIDIGCGQKKIYGGADVKTVDMNPLAAPDIICISENMKQIETAKYDFVLSSFLLNCMNDIVPSVSEMLRITRVGGYIILYLPRHDMYPDPSIEMSGMLGHVRHVKKEELDGVFNMFSVTENILYEVGGDGVKFLDFASIDFTKEYGYLYIAKKTKDYPEMTDKEGAMITGGGENAESVN